MIDRLQKKVVNINNLLKLNREKFKSNKIICLSTNDFVCSSLEKMEMFIRKINLNEFFYKDYTEFQKRDVISFTINLYKISFNLNFEYLPSKDINEEYRNFFHFHPPSENNSMYKIIGNLGTEIFYNNENDKDKFLILFYKLLSDILIEIKNYELSKIQDNELELILRSINKNSVDDFIEIPRFQNDEDFIEWCKQL